MLIRQIRSSRWITDRFLLLINESYLELLQVTPDDKNGSVYEIAYFIAISLLYKITISEEEKNDCIILVWVRHIRLRHELGAENRNVKLAASPRP